LDLDIYYGQYHTSVTLSAQLNRSMDFNKTLPKDIVYHNWHM